MKRFLSILVAVAMTISMVLPVFAYTDVADSDYAAAITHLSGLGVINGYEDGSFQPAKVVTRAEMAKLLVVALGLDAGADILTGESEFADVAANHWANGYINVATQYGLIKGDGDGNFRPDDTVNYAEVVTMALRALNYTTVVEKAGQWPTNYLNKANELKLFEDVAEVKASEGAKRGEVAQILWNMVGTEMWEVVSENEGNGLTSTANRTMLTVKFPDFNTKSTLTNGTVAYTPNYVEGEITLIEVDEDNDIKVTIGSNKPIYYKNVEAVNLSLLLTANEEAEALYTVNKDGERIGASLFIDETLVAAGMVTKVDTNNDKVWIDGVEYKTVDGKAAEAAKFDIIAVDINKDSGKVEKIYDITVSNDMIIKEIKTASDKSTVYVAEDGPGSKVTIAEDAEVIFVDAFTGKVIADSDIKVGMSIDAANVKASEKTFIRVSDVTVKGTVDAIDTTNEVLTIAGVEYKIADDARILYAGRKNHEDLGSDAIKALIKEEITVKINVDGKVAFVEASDELVVNNYAFIIKDWFDTVEGEKIYKVRLMNLAGEMADYEICTEDGKDPAELDVTEEVGMLINYELKDGKVVKTAKEVKATKVAGLNKTSKTFTAASTTLVYNANTQFVEYLVDDKEEKDENKVEMKAFAEKDFVNGDYIVIYDADSGIVDYVLAASKDSTLAEKSYGVFVKEELTADDEYTTTLKDVNGEEVKVVTGSATGLKVGDIVEYSEKANGKYDVAKVDESKATIDTAVDSTFNAEKHIADRESVKVITASGTQTTAVEVIVSSDVVVLFVNSDGTVDTTKSLEDIKASSTIYGAVKLDKEALEDTAVYSAIIVK